MLASAVAATAELAGFVALSVYTYRVGGAPLLGVLGVARMVCGAALTPVVTSWADRVRREHLLVATVAPRMLLMAAITAMLASTTPAGPVIALAGLASGLHGVFRPLQAAMIPWLAKDPEELATANGLAGIAEGTSVLAGPAIAAGVLLAGDETAVVAVATVLLILALGLLLGVHALAGTIPSAPNARRRMVGDWLGGLTTLVGDAGARVVVGPILAQVFARGVLNVLMVPLAIHLFDLGEAGVGWLGAAMGLGGLLGGPLGLAVVRGHRLGWLPGLSIICWGLPLVALGLVHAPFAAYLLFAAVGVANIVEDMSGFTAVQRLLPPHLLGRSMGAFEFLLMCASALGSATAPAMLGAAGARWTLVATGALVVAVATAAMPWLLRLGRRLSVPVAETDLLRSLPFLEPLPVGTIEHLAAQLGDATYDRGQPIVREGELGEEFFVITTGSAVVSVEGREVRRMQAGDYFGEIALMRDVPRTATVIADEPLQLRTLTRVEFLCAVTGNPASVGSLDALALDRLRTTGR